MLGSTESRSLVKFVDSTVSRQRCSIVRVVCPGCRKWCQLYLPINGIFISLQSVIDWRAHAGGHSVGVGRVRVLVGVQRWTVVQMVNGLHGPSSMGIPIHGTRYPYSIHPPVMGQVVVLYGRQKKHDQQARRQLGKEQGSANGEASSWLHPLHYGGSQDLFTFSGPILED